jgi:hypothetical protein
MRSLISWSLAERDVINRLLSSQGSRDYPPEDRPAFIGASRSGQGPRGYSNMRKQDYHVLALHIVEERLCAIGSIRARGRITPITRRRSHEPHHLCIAHYGLACVVRTTGRRSGLSGKAHPPAGPVRSGRRHGSTGARPAGKARAGSRYHRVRRQSNGRGRHDRLHAGGAGGPGRLHVHGHLRELHLRTGPLPESALRLRSRISSHCRCSPRSRSSWACIPRCR